MYNTIFITIAPIIMCILMLNELYLLLNCIRLVDINYKSMCKETSNLENEWMNIKATEEFFD